MVQLFVRAGLAKSRKDAKRLITENGARIGDVLVENAGLILSASDLQEPLKLSAGKKRHAVVNLED
ncbi:Tyrosyl-tRNA synthetase [Candidatus Rhodobacter oscarellae]|uniref:Tyrosyl-tRNA synthetase n=1 Tax=Candidatus Rhodobacter oscarellae TaxID=1675527 RepID=A0A0J9E1X3_9RHOB|nr:hypothetical protein [Candidatus Rhodobacter lobularis]KMW56720.1 Tyrosyl-tRNA synthetase [Candidatus Rhodobacter lobularis]